jgi:hypothetical protein
MYQKELEQAFRVEMVPTLEARGIVLEVGWEKKIKHPLELNSCCILAKYGDMSLEIPLYVVDDVFYGHINADHCNFAVMKWHWTPVGGTEIDADFNVAYIIRGDPHSRRLGLPGDPPGLPGVAGPTGKETI